MALESALPVGTDPREHARLLGRVREAALAGGRPPQRPRDVISASWRRVRGAGLDPSGAGEVPPLDPAGLERRREASGLLPLLPLLRASLLPAVEAAGMVMVVADPQGRVLWREGTAPARRRADALGFVEGSAWDETAVGTNAIGTSLVAGVPLHVHAAEHWAEDHVRWTCAAAPLRDPVTGRLLGAVDVSGPVAGAHPSTLALVDAVARLALLELRAGHEARRERLRVVAAPLLAGLRGPALAVTPEGVPVAASGLPAPERVLLPDGLGPGRAVLPPLGPCSVEPLPGGWLLQPDPAAREAVPELVLQVGGACAVLRVLGPSGSWSLALPPRHARLLSLLARHPQGRTAAQLAADLFGDPARTVTVRAEVSRLRRALGPLLQHQPYRLAAPLRVEGTPAVDHPDG